MDKEGNYKRGLLKAAEKIKLSSQDILLMCGELKTQELRTVKAVLKSLSESIEKEAHGC